MKLVINATNIHQGGGQTLLLALLVATKKPAIALVDSRLSLPIALPETLQIKRVEPSLVSRFKAEKLLPSLCGSDDVLLCFGNLPPLFPNRARTFVYLQNRYLTGSPSLRDLPWRVMLRVIVERIWLRSFLRSATVLVQTASMAREVKGNLNREAVIAPFAPELSTSEPMQRKEYDYLFPASGEAHKNHRRLVEAWEALAELGQYPSLRLTLHDTRDSLLIEWIMHRAAAKSLKITNASVRPESMGELYARSKALIYPSLFESFGMPLIEAQRAGLNILAAERDYVRDVTVPAQTFDPESSLSITRAVLRHLEQGMVVQQVPVADVFLASILEGS